LPDARVVRDLRHDRANFLEVRHERAACRVRPMLHRSTRPEVPTSSIEVITPLWRAAKRLADDRRRTLARMAVEPATLDLLRRCAVPVRHTS
jgi:hypothetical protein